MNASFVVSTTFEVTSLTAYGIVAFVILKNGKDFQSSYFKLYLISTIVDALTYLNSWISLRLPNITCRECPFAPLFEMKTFPGLDVSHWLINHCAYLQSGMILSMSFNRMTAFVFPTKYEKMWKKMLLPMVLAICLLPLPITYPAYTFPTAFEYINTTDTYVARSSEDRVRKTTYLIMGFSTASCLIIFFTGITLIAICKLPIKQTYSVEMKLLIHSCVNFFIFLLITLILVYTGYYPLPADIAFFNKVQAILSDLLTFFSPYVLVLCSPKLRNKTFEFLGLYQLRSTPVSLVSSSYS